jgi:hypothetical protein
MFDWSTEVDANRADCLPVGEIRVKDPGGVEVLNRQTHNDYVGSFDAKMRLYRLNVPETWWCEGMPEKCLGFSFNPVRQVQEHNVMGPSAGLLREAVEEVKSRLRAEHPEYHLDPFGKSELEPIRSRVDVNVSVRFPNQGMVEQFLSFALNCSRSRSGKASPDAPHSEAKGMRGVHSVYWQNKSRLWRMKMYGKFEELKVHPVKDPRLQAALLEFANGLVRIELTLFTEALKVEKVINEGLIFEYQDSKIIFGESTGGTEMNGIEGLSALERLTLDSFLAKNDVKSTLSKSSFYRVRARLLEKTGYDIASPATPQMLERRRVVNSPDVAYLRSHVVKNEDLPAALRDTIWEPGKNKADCEYHPVELRQLRLPEKPKHQMELQLSPG